MTACPKCGRQNEAGSQFCIQCGTTLTGITPADLPAGARGRAPMAQSHRELLAAITTRLLVTLFGLWLFTRVLISLTFVRDFFIPDIGMTLEQVIVSLAFLGGILVILLYIPALRATWSRALPGQDALLTVILALVYLVLLSVVFTALRTPLTVLDADEDVFIVLRLVLVLLAVILVSNALRTLYRAAPDWWRRLSTPFSLGGSKAVACLNCGRVNSADTIYCGHCGSHLSGEGPAGSA